MKFKKYFWRLVRGKVWKLKEIKFKFRFCYLCCVNLGKFYNFFEFRFFYLRMSIIVIIILGYFK